MSKTFTVPVDINYEETEGAEAKNIFLKAFPEEVVLVLTFNAGL
jgi:hypothetical protein